MPSFISRVGRWPLVLTLAALGACSDAPAGPSRVRTPVGVNRALEGVAIVFFTIDSVTVNRTSGDANAHGTVVCTTPAAFDLVVQMSQQQRDGSVYYWVDRTNRLTAFPCSPEPATWSVPLAGPWQSRAATVTVKTENENGTAQTTVLSQTVRIRKR